MHEQNNEKTESLGDPRFELTELDGDMGIPTELKGFRIICRTATGYASAKCFEGYHLDITNDDTEVVDPDFFGIESVANKTGEPGIASSLVRASLQEAIRRGFSKGRVRVLNPKILTILEKMQSEGLVSDIECYLGDNATRIHFSTSELAARYTPVTSEVAKQHLEMYPDTNDVINEDAVAETVFRIANQSDLEPK